MCRAWFVVGGCLPIVDRPSSCTCCIQGAGLSWLFPLKDGAPPIGWHDAGAYLVLPVLLVLSQYISQKVVSPSNQQTDPSQQSTQAILKFIPFMIGATGPGNSESEPCSTGHATVASHQACLTFGG